jgi:5'-deoxynucleotidase YfbR-like HD superfamily hydrolase
MLSGVVTGCLVECCAALEVEQLWLEYEQQMTPESHLVKDFDKLEMIIQVCDSKLTREVQRCQNKTGHRFAPF